jgi:precorrin-2/cobalt-factor-2 C20-methyltransferase
MLVNDQDAGRKTAGKFYGIGVGPGDPELLTLKGARLLREVDWIFLPAGMGQGDGFAAGIVAPLGLDRGKFRPVTLCMSREREADLDAYAQAAGDILAALRRGESAAWITEGDPLFYSTFAHLAAALRRLDPRVVIDIVPGITSMQAAAAAVQMPVAMLAERVAVVPAVYGIERLSELLEGFTFVCLLKVHTMMDRLLDRLAQLPRRPLCYYVEKVGTAEERIVNDLASLRGRQLPYFSLVLLRRDAGRES